MMMFALGYGSAIATYFLIGACLGVYVVCTNLARFFAAGWRWKAMALTIWDVALTWPLLWAR
jgi:hypothetical protein